MVVVDDATNKNDEALTLRTVFSECNSTLHIAPIFSNLHKMKGK
jgi:hypothetical protein